ncbi:TonB-dependent receptor domain-containing protein [Sphingomonas sp. CLY1604]|uniref:TonB-dependent receptor domain-containing protein n=1 Tax=Sphingomonas sp. CLY1604 TaxID=3457786 RepID=UPI003FD84A57
MTGQAKHRKGRRSRAGRPVFWAAVLLAVCSVASAQQPTTRYDLPAQDLGTALRDLARASGRQVAFDSRSVAGKRSQRLSGNWSTEAALRRLLAGSGLGFTRGRSGIFIIVPLERAPANPPPPATPPSDDIIVTARKREERAVDVPIAISGVSGATAERNGAADLSAVLRETPGVAIFDTGVGLQRLVIRGISTSLGANENGYYLDDLPFTGVTVPIAPDVRAWDLDRVEVLRGPQGTLFGEGSLGGTVRILTKGAQLTGWSTKGQDYLSATAGGGTNAGFKAALNVPVIPDMLAFRVSGTAERLSGWIDDDAAGEHDVNGQRIVTWRARMRFDPARHLSIDGSYWSYRGRFPASASATDDGQRPRTDGLENDLRYDLYNASGRYDMGRTEIFYGYSRSEFSLPWRGRYLGGTLISDIGIKVGSHELRLASKGDRPLRWTVGAYARDAWRRDNLQLALFGIDNLSVTNSKARALFGEATWTPPSAPIDLTVGLRYYREKLAGSATDASTVGPNVGDVYRSWNPRFSVAWHPVDDATIYASAAKGFRAGQLQPTASARLAEALGIALPATLRQDSIWTYELGAKVDLLPRLTLEASGYYSDWRDVAVRVPIGTTGFNGLVNSAGTRTIGGEMAVALHPIRGMTLTGSASYADAVYVATVPGTGIVRGRAVDEVAKLLANAAVDYRTRLGGDAQGFGRIGLQHSSPRRFVSFPGYLPGDRISRIDARVGLELGQVSIALFADNLLNENGAVNSRTVQQQPSGPDDIFAVRLRPRTLGIELSLGLAARP